MVEKMEVDEPVLPKEKPKKEEPKDELDIEQLKRPDASIEDIKKYIAQIDQYEKRSLDPFLAKGFFYMTLVAERRNEISQLRGYLNSRLRIATLRNQ
uniref:Uncharacterized protein n=1 Tax=Panagrolaimus sp. PS1159 TaxID=55785 RepID=A0AC35FF66_9BILA